jgi:hypothetical protein
METLECVEFKKLNATTKIDPYPLSFNDKVLNIVIGHDVYSFLDGYHQISIALEDIYKITFVIDWGTLTLVVMPFGVNNEPPTY